MFSMAVDLQRFGQMGWWISAAICFTCLYPNVIQQQNEFVATLTADGSPRTQRDRRETAVSSSSRRHVPCRRSPPEVVQIEKQHGHMTGLAALPPNNVVGQAGWISMGKEPMRFRLRAR
jgi:hypothetical protein